MKLKIPPPIQGLIAALAIWFADYLLSSLSVVLPGQRLLAVLLLLTGLAIDLFSVFSFYKARTTVSPLSPHKTRTLVTTGIFSVSRNPMYLGMLMMLTGWWLWNGNLLGIVPIVVFVFAINRLQIEPEERVLEQKFKEDYARYKKSVRRWV